MEKENEHVYLLVTVCERQDEATDAVINVFKTAANAINDAKWAAEAQKRIEGASFIGLDEYENGVPSVPSMHMLGKPVYASCAKTMFRGRECRAWRAVYESRLF